MPRKMRQLRADLAQAGFVKNTKRGKGSHTWWGIQRFRAMPSISPAKTGMTRNRTRKKRSRKPCNERGVRHDIIDGNGYTIACWQALQDGLK